MTVEKYNRKQICFELECRKCSTCELYSHKPEEQFDTYKRIFLKYCYDCNALFCQYCYYKEYKMCLECMSSFGDLLTSINYKNIE